MRVLQEESVRIFFLDEAIFSFNTMVGKAWAHKNFNVTVTEKQVGIKAHALIAAVSAANGLEHFKIVPRSVKDDDFNQFLRELRDKFPNERMAIFMDNMRVHHSRKSKASYHELGMVPIFNVPYSPQFNGIEPVFGMIKVLYKKELLSCVMNNRKVFATKLIGDAIRALEIPKI